MKIYKNSFAILVFVLCAAASAQQPDQELRVRTNYIGQMANGQVAVAAVTNNGNWYSISCAGGIVHSSADLLLPTEQGDLTTNNYKETTARQVYSKAKSPSIPLTEDAVTKVCNFPNGIYVLKITTINGSQQVDFVSSPTLEASSKHGSRGF
jgi:hypothetical protein